MATTFLSDGSAILAQDEEPRIDRSTAVVIRYTNYRGETADRRIVPIRIRFGSTEWHPEEQWLLEAFDLDRDATRAFALRDVSQWGSQCEFNHIGQERPRLLAYLKSMFKTRRAHPSF